jgi:hypothetical protein
MPEASERLVGAPMVAFTPASRPRWVLDRSIDVPDTRAPRDARALAAAAAEAERAISALPPRLAATALQRDAIAAAPARTFPGPPATGSAYDAGLAVGRAHVLVTENFSVAIIDKATGIEVSRTSLIDWFPSRPPAATFVFDPRALYDQYADRWIVIALAWDRPVLAGLAGSWLLICVSRGADPTGEWLGSAIDTFNDAATPDGWADYPCLGLDEQALYVTYNVRNDVGRLLVFAKTDLYDDGAATPFDFRDLANPDGAKALTVQPCHHFGASDAARLVNTLSIGIGEQASAVVIRSVTWAAGRPSLGAPQRVDVHPYATPPKEAEQLGEKALDVGGVRVRSALCRSGSIWLAFATAHRDEDGGTGIAARWCRIDPLGVRLQAQDELFERGAHHVFPNLMVDAAGNLILVSSRSAATEHPSLHYGHWLAAGPARAGVLVAGRGPHRRCRAMKPCEDADARNGWGDYNGIALDPVDGFTVWAFGGVGHETDRTLWATAIVAL